MATSGSEDFNLNRDDIINLAFSLIGYRGVNRTLDPADIDNGKKVLNMMVKAWNAKGIYLWTEIEGVLFLADNTGSYIIDGSSSHATKATDAKITSLNGALATSATAVTVDSTSGMTASDYIGIVLTSEVTHWTTISAVNSSTTLTLASGVASAASDNAAVFTYTSKLIRPLKITSARRVSGIDNGTTINRSEVNLNILPQSEYDFLPNKTLLSTPTALYYKSDVSSGTINLWPQPTNPSEYIRFTYQRSLEDFDASGNTPDFPAEWLEALTYQLALRLAPMYGREDKVQVLAPVASAMLIEMTEGSSEGGDIQLIPIE